MDRTMTLRLKWTIAATLIILALMLWYGEPTVTKDPTLWNQYKMTHLEGH